MSNSPLVSLINVEKEFKVGDSLIMAVNNVSLDIEEGDFLSIIGMSGSGKSTLMNIIGGLDFSSGGDVLLEGSSLLDLSEEELAVYRNRYVGFVFQQFYLNNEYTVLENVVMPMYFSDTRGEKVREAKARSVISAVGLSKRIKHKAFQLSGGERQRVAIARAIVLEPKILIADEPTGNLDSKTGKEIADLIASLNKNQGITVIIVTHDEDLARCANKRYFMKDGKLTKRNA